MQQKLGQLRTATNNTVTQNVINFGMSFLSTNVQFDFSSFLLLLIQISKLEDQNCQLDLVYAKERDNLKQFQNDLLTSLTAAVGNFVTQHDQRLSKVHSFR